MIGFEASKTLEKTIDHVTRVALQTAQAICVVRDVRANEITVVDG